MKKNEITKTVEQVIRTEYIAEDGVIFYNEAECKAYEESALFVVSKKLKKLNKEWESENSLLEAGSNESELEIFDVQTQEDLDNLKRYLYLKAIKNGAKDEYIKECFTDVHGKRQNFVFDNVTYGHEVMVFWSYDSDWFWVYGDGSLEGYCDFIRGKYKKIMTKAENKS